MHEIIKKSLELRYHIELAADGLVDGIGCTLTIPERLALLLQRRARWRYLDWTAVKPIPAPALCQAYELVDGVLASSMADVPSRGSRHLALTWLPTSREPQERTVERHDLGITVRDFAIDPSQDLIAMVLVDEAGRCVFYQTVVGQAPSSSRPTSWLYFPHDPQTETVFSNEASPFHSEQ